MPRQPYASPCEQFAHRYVGIRPDGPASFPSEFMTGAFERRNAFLALLPSIWRANRRLREAQLVQLTLLPERNSIMGPGIAK